VWTPISSAVTINVRRLMFLIDTNLISEARKGRRADAGVQDFWAPAARDNTPLFLAAITIGELRRGVEFIRHRGDQPQAKLLEQWLAESSQTYGDRVLDLDGDAAQIWGRLRVPNAHNAIDKQIAAIALLHDLTVVTPNVDDLAGCGVRLLNPFSRRRDAPPSALAQRPDLHDRRAQLEPIVAGPEGNLYRLHSAPGQGQSRWTSMPGLGW